MSAKNLLVRGPIGAALLIGGAVGCTSAAEPTSSPAAEPASTPASAAAPSPAMSLTEWFDAEYEKELMLSPLGLTMQGRKERYGELDDFSKKGFDERLALKKASVEELKAKFDYASLSPAEKVSYDVWVYQYEEMAASEPFFYDGYTFHQMDGPQSFAATFLINFHTVESESDLEALISRLKELGRVMGQLVEGANIGLEKGTRYPKFALEGTITQARAIITGKPFTDGDEDSALWADIKTEVEKLQKSGTLDEAKAKAHLAAARTALVEIVKPAYDEIIAWAEAQLPKAMKVATGVGAQPNGAAFYRQALSAQTTTQMTPDEIHALGLAEVARLQEEMKGVMKQVKFKGDLQAFFKKVREGKWNYYPDTDEGRVAYITDAKAAIDNIETRLPDFFNLMPKAQLVVKRVEPFRERDGAAQHYFPSTPDGSRPGTYYAHLSDMTAMPKNQLEVIAYHEGIPGHHMQIAIAQELTEVPKFRTQSFFTAYAEGWALYAEKLAKEMPGTYKDPYSEFGRLTSEIFRAIRLVVDTGLHAKGWNEQKAIEYFSANSPEPLESITSEVRRYMVMPGQATCYKIGMIKVLALRAKAEAALGEAFDIRAFHDALLEGGGVPLEILERQVDLYIASARAA